jgi:3-oxoacyl-(acyl-carrier-protein) synthase
MIRRRVVVTGMGVVAPNAHGLDAYAQALREGRSGIRHLPSLRECRFGCQVGGIPVGIDALAPSYLSPEALYAMNSQMLYAAIAGIDCWRDAGFEVPAWDTPNVDWDTGAWIGTGAGGAESLQTSSLEAKVRAGQIRKLGGAIVEQTMMSSASAKLGGLLALGGHVSTNSTACATGTEAVVESYYHIATGRGERMLAGGSEGATEASAPFAWAGFDAMRVTARNHNESPPSASRPMSATASGLVPAGGAGVLMLESLDSARRRGVRIYAEILGAHVNCGGQRGGGSMTAANPRGVIRCIRAAVEGAGISPREIDAINGHLTATVFDPGEIAAWSQALEREGDDFPWINATKSIVGHALGASGALECIAAVLQLHHGFLHPSLNCEDIHPALEAIAHRIPQRALPSDARIMAKASFGFGDVNACVLFRKGSEA